MLSAKRATEQRPPPVHITACTSGRFAEIAGGKTAECVAICCCLPCGLANLLIFTIIRLPAWLFRRVLRKRIRNRRVKRKAKLLGYGTCSNSSSRSDSDVVDVGSGMQGEVEDVFVGMHGGVMMVIGDSWPERSPSAEIFELEKEVWSKFCGGGFWRTPSHGDDLLLVHATEQLPFVLHW